MAQGSSVTPGSAGQPIVAEFSARSRRATISACAVGSWLPMGCSTDRDHLARRRVDDHGAHRRLAALGGGLRGV